MNTNTGEIVEYVNIPAGRGHEFIEVKRSLTVKEKFDVRIRLYSPCGCGSGKKFKFCCKK